MTSSIKSKSYFIQLSVRFIFFIRFSMSILILHYAFCILHCEALLRLVGPSGLEPPTSCLSGTRSNLLSYEPLWLVSDLSHLVVEMMGFEPMTPCLQGRCSPS